MTRKLVFGIGCLLAAGLVSAAYSNHFDNGFHFDDSHVIVNNLAIRSLHDVPRFFSDPLTFTARPENAAYRPLLTLSYAWDYARAGGLTPRVFHQTQFALLLALGAGLLALYRHTMNGVTHDSRNGWVALAGATWFCVHTANTETVNYLSSRSSLVATLAVVTGLLVYSAFPRARPAQLHLIPMVVGGLAKPLTVMYAPILLVYCLLFEEGLSVRQALRDRRSSFRALRRSAPAFVVGAGLYFFLRRMDAKTLLYADVDRWTYLITQPEVWLHYVRLFFVPVGLTADTDWRFLSDWRDPGLLYGLLSIVAVVAGIVFSSERAAGRPVAFGLSWFCLALLPTSSVFPLSEVYNEHRIFFPYAGLTLAATWAAWLGLSAALRGRPKTIAIVSSGLVLAVLSGHAAGTHLRNRAWQTSETLWADVAAKSPNNGRGLMNYGLALMRRGELERARELFERARVFTPDYSILEINLGIVKSALGDPESAEPHFDRALRLTPRYARGRFFYGRWLVEQGRAPEALHQLRLALEISPGDVDATYLLLNLLAAAGDDDAVRREAGRALEIAPTDDAIRAFAEGRLPFVDASADAAALRKAGRTRIQRERWMHAAAVYRRSLELDPESVEAWNNLGWALGHLGFLDEAIAGFERALRLDPDDELARNNLTWAVERRDAALRGTHSP